MGEKTKVTLERIIEINDAVLTAADCSLLDSKIAWRAGMLADSCKSPIKVYNKIVAANKKKFIADQKVKQKELIGKSDEEKKVVVEALQGLIDKYNEQDEALLADLVEIEIPEFKLADFTAKEELRSVHRVKDKDVEVVVKAGQTLVPVRFFALMGSLIKE